MYLKRLQLLGFKSFADKIEIVFQPGITAVVGPNGCGKSNIADALRWVLGEQSLRALRGAKMDDVIFAGSESRKQLGFAEVELVLDNSDGYLPLDFAEVAVARRLYRSGESEYLLNRSTVRLRDVQELFLDTGLGKEAYSVIGQGKIDAILSAKAEDRRAIFEEAAGVVKYKMRKASALRRLEETEANLLRALDLLTELESQLGPLQAQALVAEECQRLQVHLAQLDINLTGHELIGMQGDMSRAQEELAGAHEREQDLAREEAVLEASLEELRLAGMTREDEIARRQQEVFSLANRGEQERGRLELAREKIRAHSERSEAVEANRREQETKRASLRIRRQEQASALAEAGQVRAKLKTALAESESRIAARDSAAQDLAKKEEDLKSEILEDMNRVAAAKNGLQSVQMERDFLGRAGQDLEAKLASAGAATAEAAIRLAQAAAAGEEFRAADARVVQEETAAAEKRRRSQESLAGLDAKNQQWREKIKGIESRLNLMEEMERTYQGYFPGVRSVLVEAREEPFARGIKGLIAELISVKPGYEIALEIALGSALQFVVIEEDRQAQAAIAYLKSTGRGRATFLPLNMIRGRQASGPGLAEAMAASEACQAADLLDFAPEYRPIIDYLLGQTLVAPTLAQAVDLAKRTQKAFRIVTKEGEVVNAGGSLTGGALDQRKMQILGRKREIEDLRQERENALSFLAKGQAEADRSRAEIAEAEAGLATLAEQRRQLAHDLAGAAKTWENIRQEEKRLREEAELFGLQQAENQDRARELGEREQIFRQDLTAAEGILAAHRQELEDLGAELKKHQDEKDTALQSLTDHRVSLAAKSEEEKKHQEALAETERLISEMDEGLAALGRELTEIAASLESLRREDEQIQVALTALAAEGEAAGLALNGVLEERGQAQGQIKKAEGRLRVLRRERGNLADQAHRFELSLGEWRVRAETARAHLLEEYGLTWEDRLDPAWEMDRGEAAIKIEGLRAEIRALGPVNPGAIAEYDGLKERYEFLRRQSDDLQQARESLQKIIAEVERTISHRFLETFGSIKEKFAGIFQQLFAGGKAELILLDPGDPLESGIEVVAQPPGKRLQSLMLLSGGERAMTAIALLFAILEIKPSPFCILDEIDATLDEANVARFAELLSHFSQKMQFIVVTHRRGTMEAAGALYGVTMEELGVSKLISLQLEKRAG